MSSAPNTDVNYGTVIAPGTLAPYHQHLFSLRIDPAIDGHLNTIVIEESKPMPINEQNPHGIGYYTEQTKITKEGTADIDPLKNRIFKILNPTSLNPVNGHPVAYCVVPHNSQVKLYLFSNHSLPSLVDPRTHR